MRDRADRPWHPGAVFATVAVIVVVAAVGAFVWLGPIGFGTGPLRLLAGNAVGTGIDTSSSPVALVSPLSETGGVTVRIDKVQLVAGHDMKVPRLLAAFATSDQRGCGYQLAYVQQTSSHDLTLSDCPSELAVYGSVVGMHIGPQSKPLSMTTEVTAPSPTGCWAIHAIVVHYRVGIKHYTATIHQAWAVCGPRTTALQRMDATGAAGLS